MREGVVIRGADLDKVEVLFGRSTSACKKRPVRGRRQRTPDAPCIVFPKLLEALGAELRIPHTPTFLAMPRLVALPPFTTSMTTRFAMLHDVGTPDTVATPPHLRNEIVPPTTTAMPRDIAPPATAAPMIARRAPLRRSTLHEILLVGHKPLVPARHAIPTLFNPIPQATMPTTCAAFPPGPRPPRSQGTM